MGLNRTTVVRAVESGLAALELELAELRARQLQSVLTETATGTGDIDNTFQLDKKYRLVFIRCHFSGTTNSATFTVSLDSGSGSAYDATLFTLTQAGVGRDVFLRIGGGDTGDPSAWTFQSGDSVRVQWTNPDSGNITWGLEVGLAPAS